MTIRPARREDIPTLAAIEAVCFTPATAATLESLTQRYQAFPECFFVAEEDGAVIGFINGAVTDSETICDEMYENAALHNPHGAYQSVFGINTLPPYRCRHAATRMMEALLSAARQRGQAGAILTCKEEMIPFYEKMGYRCLGKSQSVHGGVVWYDMKLLF